MLTTQEIETLQAILSELKAGQVSFTMFADGIETVLELKDGLRSDVRAAMATTMMENAEACLAIAKKILEL